MEKTLTVGEILKPQGIRGELKVKPFTDTADVFRCFRHVWIDGEEYKVLSVRIGDGAVFLGLKGVPDRNAAELMRGKAVELLREEAPEPGEGRYYIVDLLGSEVVSEEGKLLGILTDVRQASSDVYTIEKDGKEILFPALKDAIVCIDVAAKRIVLNEKRFFEIAVF